MNENKKRVRDSKLVRLRKETLLNINKIKKKYLFISMAEAVSFACSELLKNKEEVGVVKV